jgi:hypothetical protein
MSVLSPECAPKRTSVDSLRPTDSCPAAEVNLKPFHHPKGAVVMTILWTIIIGFVAGVIAKFITPGDNEPSGFILTRFLASSARSSRHTLARH